MDFNNIKKRIERIYASINERFDNDLEKHINIEKKVTDSFQSFKVSFDKKQKEAEISNKIISIIHNLANIKDNLKNKLKGRGDDPNLIEQEINNSLPVKIVIDLSNQEKHGYPLTKYIRSYKNPQICNIESILRISNGEFMFDPITEQINSSGGCGIAIKADINDGQGNFICRLDKLIDDVIVEWGKIINKYNIT